MIYGKKAKFSLIGLMSGTSLDGVDIAHCLFELIDDKWIYSIESSETIRYTSEWKKELIELENTTALYFQEVNTLYGKYLGGLVKMFVEKHQLEVDFVASHGHTIFHEPTEKQLTTQLGAGSAIAAECDLPVVCDFRSLDVALGGQGAPLVPIGDRLLFSEYDFCLNIGGFVNVSYEYNKERIAYDICPANIVLNALCEKIDMEYDDGGEIAASGIIHNVLLEELNNLSYYKLSKHSPKSLGKEWVIAQVNPLLDKHQLSIADALKTVSEHIAMQIAKALSDIEKGKMLLTGGGAFNDYLVTRIKHYSAHTVEIPSSKLIDFKEALLFSFLGVLRVREEVNCLKSVTGANRDNCGGAIYGVI